jgi:hypothetical protein
MIIIRKYIQYNTITKNIVILEKMTINQIYNQMKEDFLDYNLISYSFPIEVIDHKGNYRMLNGWLMMDTRNII